MNNIDPQLVEYLSRASFIKRMVRKFRGDSPLLTDMMRPLLGEGTHRLAYAAMPDPYDSLLYNLHAYSNLNAYTAPQVHQVEFTLLPMMSAIFDVSYNVDLRMIRQNFRDDCSVATISKNNGDCMVFSSRASTCPFTVVTVSDYADLPKL